MPTGTEHRRCVLENVLAALTHSGQHDDLYDRDAQLGLYCFHSAEAAPPPPQPPPPPPAVLLQALQAQRGPSWTTRDLPPAGPATRLAEDEPCGDLGASLPLVGAWLWQREALRS